MVSLMFFCRKWVRVVPNFEWITLPLVLYVATAWVVVSVGAGVLYVIFPGWLFGETEEMQ